MPSKVANLPETNVPLYIKYDENKIDTKSLLLSHIKTPKSIEEESILESRLEFNSEEQKILLVWFGIRFVYIFTEILVE